uniref:Adaptin_N domain-containing protein n=1 Tax=Heterorhabditis bacteriophora TaxID=37862 RepID=A0A1I7XUF2_HETBA
MYDSSVALGGLACFVTPDLARDLACDIVNLLSSSRAYTRKRAVLLLYKIFLKYPESLRPTFPRLKEKLEDPDPGVQSASVNVICELARKNPKNYLTLAPVFFKLMTTSSNNWMLIKIIKLLCVQKLGVLIEDSDQNLKYLGLLAMGKILQTHPKAVQAHKDIVLRCLDDKDESIRLRALDLLYGMVSKKNIMEIVKKLMEHVESAEGSHYRDELLSRIIGICSYNNYQYITNFEWYISVLVELTKVEGTKHGAKIAEQIQDVTVRVESIRHFSVSQMALLVENAHILLAGSAQQRSNICEVLLAAAWICGEYSQLEDDWDAIESLDNLMLSKLPEFELAEHLEAQERACTLMSLLRVLESMHSRREKMASEVASLYEGELNPVAAKAQRKVPVPQGLDLDSWINDPWEETPNESSEASDIDGVFGQTLELSIEEKERRRKQREAEIKSNPYYVKGTATLPKRPTRFVSLETQDAMEKTDVQSPLEIPGVVGLSRYMEQQDSTLTWKKAKEDKKKKKGKKGKRKRHASSSSEEEVTVIHQVNRADGEMPEGAKSTDDDDDHGVSDEFRALDINLDEPLRPEEVVRGPQAYARIHPVNRQQTVCCKKYFQFCLINEYSSLFGVLIPRSPTTGSQLNHNPLDIGKSKKTTTRREKDDGSVVKKKKKSKRKTLTLSEPSVVLDIDTWLSTPSTGVIERAANTIKTEKKIRKKKKLTSVRETYEEASGVCTPSNPNFERGVSPRINPCNTSPRLCSNSDLIVDYETMVSPENYGEILTRLSMKNMGNKQIKNIEVNVIDTLNTRFIRDDDPANYVSGAICPGEFRDVHLRFSLSSISITQTLRGTITYFAQDDEGTIEDKLDFKFLLRSTDLIIPATISKYERYQWFHSKDGYSQLLSGGDIDFSSSVQFLSELPFPDLLGRLTTLAHLTVVEEVSSAVSLFGHTLLSQPICVLLKKTADNVHIRGKAGDQQLVDVIVEDLRDLCLRK